MARTTLHNSLLSLVGFALCACARPAPQPLHDADSDGGAADADLADGDELDADQQGDGWPLRVWAPGATAVRVVTDGERGADLAGVDGGAWEGRVPGLGLGGEYSLAITADGGTVERIDTRALKVSDDGSRSIVYEPAFDWGEAEAGFVRPDLCSAVVYELHVGTFARDESGRGTFSTAMERLDHLEALGVDVIELMPVQEFPGESSWGYNTWAPFVVERAYGGPEELAELVDAAHQHGIAVVLDVVYNHLDRTTPLCDFLGIVGGCGAPYIYPDERGETDWGPRPDFSAPGVREYIGDNVDLWLDSFHIDGFRFDSTSNIWNTHNGEGDDLPEGWELLASLNDRIDAFGEGLMSIAEDFHGGEDVTSPPDDGGMGFDAQWDGWFHWEVHRCLVEDACDLSSLAEALRFRDNDDPFQRVIYTESHDTTGLLNDHARLPQEIDDDDPGSWSARKRSTLAAALLFTTPGVPMILQGQEMLQAGAFHDTEPLDWDNADRFSGVLALYTDLIALRRDLWGTTRGLGGSNIAVDQIDTANLVIAFRRWDSGGRGDDVVVAANLGDEEAPSLRVGFPACGFWQVRLDTDDVRYGDDYSGPSVAEVEAESVPQGALPCSAELTLGPYTAVVLSQTP